MSDCKCLPGCLFFNNKMKEMPGIADMMKKKYCKGDNLKCARYMVFSSKGKDAVPEDLYPNMVDRAKSIIAKG